jgi:hypothetical protein
MRSVSWTRALKYICLALVTAYMVATVVRVVVRKYYIFLPDYARWTFTPTVAPSGATHIFFMFVDHFEPEYDADRTRRWGERYEKLAARHHDSVGRPPQHTFFYPGEQTTTAILEELRRLTAAGLGEVELHYHHDFDTADTLRPKLADAIEKFQRFGFLKTVAGETRFAFIHGNFGLDNGAGPSVCGVNRELELLRQLGCFADFSFPSVYVRAQPPLVNAIYAAKDDDSPKSYEAALPLSALSTGAADLMIFEGPLVFAPTLNLRRLFLDLDDGDIHAAKPPSAARVDRWVRANVHVPARPDWVFVKIFAHGVSSPGDEEAVLGPEFDQSLTYLERQYNDGTRFVLHYITAREGYNLALAAANGESGDPNAYLDRYIAPYLAGAGRPNSSLTAAAREPN